MLEGVKFRQAMHDPAATSAVSPVLHADVKTQLEQMAGSETKQEAERV